MENWLSGVLCAPELRAVEKLALVELYPDADEAAVRAVSSEFGDRPAVMQWLEKLGGWASVSDLQTTCLDA